MMNPSAREVEARICKNVLVVTDYCWQFHDCTAKRKNQLEVKQTQLIRNMPSVTSGHCIETST